MYRVRKSWSDVIKKEPSEISIMQRSVPMPIRDIRCLMQVEMVYQIRLLNQSVDALAHEFYQGNWEMEVPRVKPP